MTPIKVAVAGLGTVGAGTLKLLGQNAARISARAGRPIAVTAVSARDRKRNRGVVLDNVPWFDDPVRMANEADADIIVELIGGAEGVARSVCEAALKRGRHLVTANKALLALHGTELALLAEEKGATLAFEAAVGGGIPIIKALRESLAGNSIKQVYGILNGTCNYILTTMREQQRDFGEVLAEAQKLGYAEADPSFDIDGIDAAHKLAILTSLAFGTVVDFRSVHVEGIRPITALDIRFADELGYRIKLLGIARRREDGIEQRVHPCMVPKTAPIARVEGVFNAIVAEGDAVGPAIFEGRGAGAGPTASAVVSDLVDIAAGRQVPAFAVAARHLEKPRAAPLERRRGAYYVRFMVLDRPGVFADIAAALRDEQVSMESILQRGQAPDESVPVVMTLHNTEEAAMNRAIKRIAALGTVVEPPLMIRIETF